MVSGHKKSSPKMPPCTSPGHVPTPAHLLYTPAQTTATLGSQPHCPTFCVIRRWASHDGHVLIVVVVMRHRRHHGRDVIVMPCGIWPYHSHRMLWSIRMLRLGRDRGARGSHAHGNGTMEHNELYVDQNFQLCV